MISFVDRLKQSDTGDGEKKGASSVVKLLACFTKGLGNVIAAGTGAYLIFTGSDRWEIT